MEQADAAQLLSSTGTSVDHGAVQVMTLAERDHGGVKAFDVVVFREVRRGAMGHPPSTLTPPSPFTHLQGTPHPSVVLVVPAGSFDAAAEQPNLLAAVALLFMWRQAARQQGHVRDCVLVGPRASATCDAVVLAEAAVSVLHCKPPVQLKDVVQTLCNGRSSFTVSPALCGSVQK